MRAVPSRTPAADKRARSMLLRTVATIAFVSAHPAAATEPAGAFRGTISSTIGDVTRTPTSNVAETITIGSNQATINWSPNESQGSGNIVFLPKGNTATFVNGASVSDYTVLNRIIPTNANRKIELDGKVISQLQSASGTAVGGHVWFYSPGGIILGASAVFDVGSLLLTANDPASGWTSDANGFSASFSAREGKTTEIDIHAGAQVNATANNSYVALIAPVVEQRGTVTVNGSAAFVAAEQLTMTLNQGLFDVHVDVGSVDDNGIIHSGTTTGPASAGALDPHNIYMIAVPKNQAMTMLLSGTVGFAPADSVSIENGEIVLSNVYGGESAGLGARTDLASGPEGSDIILTDVSFSSAVEVLATGSIKADGATTTFGDDAALHALQDVVLGDVIAERGLLITAGGLFAGGDLSAADALQINAGSSLTAGGVTAGRELALTSSGALQTGDLASGGTLAVNGGSNVSLGNLDGGKQVTVAAGGALKSAKITAGGSASLKAGTDLESGAINSEGSVTADAGGDLVLTDVRSPSTIDLKAGGTASLFGAVAGPTITVTSADIDIADTALLGQSGVTQLLTLNAVSAGAPIVIGQGGGAALAAQPAGLQYQLEDLGNINTGTLVVNAVGGHAGVAPDMLMLNASVESGAISHVELNTGGSVFVEGTLAFNGAAATDWVAINAGDKIQLNTTLGGRIVMTAADGTPGGVLELTADDIWLAGQPLLDQLATDPNFAGRDQALATNSGAPDAEGNLTAGGMLLTVGKSLLVQNTGTEDDFAGITVGHSGLIIRPISQSPVTVVGYGRELNNDGSISGGGDFYKQIVFDTTGGGFSDGSTVNGCDVSAGCALRPAPFVPRESIFGPVEMDIDGTLPVLINADLDSDNSLIDDPVTSGSDPSFWDDEERRTRRKR